MDDSTFKKFSYNNYSDLLNQISGYLPIMSFDEINPNTSRFLIIRHDVEFSVNRAYAMALIEKKLGISSNYFFQIRSNSYNLLSKQNIEMILSIKKMGHNIGLHVHLGSYNESLDIKDYILNDINILSNILGISINSFSFHRPSRRILEKNIKIDGIINTYQDLFFELTDDFENAKVRYISDSNHQWKYGDPFNVKFKNIQKLQLLIHPDNWTKSGENNIKNFKHLIIEKNQEIRDTFKEECITYPPELN
tara:strand:- start:1545 stop:2294 length:750 start_codon:yes stop_codon:yes gene_type:complete